MATSSINEAAQLAFVRYPEDWRGRTVELWIDGVITLDSGLTSHERKAAGQAPIDRLLISETITEGEILDWISRRSR